MPNSMCPVCGAILHLSISDHATWYAERHPEAAFGSLVPEVCLACCGTIDVGDEVVTRRLKNEYLDVEPKQMGKVAAVLINKEFGNLYVVRFEDGKELTCPRIAIRKQFGNH